MELEFEWQCLAPTVCITVLLEKKFDLYPNRYFLTAAAVRLSATVCSKGMSRGGNTNTITWLMPNSISIEPSHRSYCKWRELHSVSRASPPKHACTSYTHSYLAGTGLLTVYLEILNKKKPNKNPTSFTFSFLQLCSRRGFDLPNPRWTRAVD